MTGGEAVVRSLEAHKIEVVFGIPGTHNLAIYDALTHSEKIRHIVARHEQGAASMADGYARASGHPGVCITTTGPAALNAVSSLGTAYADSSQVLLIASQNPVATFGLEKGLIHECPKQLEALQTVVGEALRPESTGAISKTIFNAFGSMSVGRARPSAIEIPIDLLNDEDSIDILFPETERPAAFPVSKLIPSLDLIKSSIRPAVWAGGGVITANASEALVRFAEKLKAPVFTTVMGKGAIPGSHSLSAGSALNHWSGRSYLETCDLLIAVGTRFTDEETDSWTLKLPEKVIHIDIDPQSIGPIYVPTISLIADAKLSLGILDEHLLDHVVDNGSNRVMEVKKLRKELREDCLKKAPEGVHLVDSIQAGLPSDAIVVSDLTLMAYWCRRLLDFYEPRSNLYPWGFGTLGFALPAAIGAKLARPERPVVAICGDGGFMFNLQELATAIQHEVPIVLLVFNDNSYGVLEKQQEVLFGRKIGVNLYNPDFIALAKSFGIKGERVDTIDALEDSLSRAVCYNDTYLIEITVPVPWPVMEPSVRIFEEREE
ncbi:MAG: putative 2-ketoarginine decarboxylase AruI [Candidatus Moanabacter tarae]|uniref:Putative 2-ketoarginine decarboxylase AruI n=1 Tax=Candidatus Moanibacter tarae TaxID=2200854 RepID=A0A2Z4AB88_9BACT|nr:MAG: putative 2-ketoarginine decarboxylase AruI [Candidatus Moanabacter tarae]|tara:strand:- start:12 stop:1652 length:1641 start_codon:yes stop_codon:yes gene_type:complete